MISSRSSARTAALWLLLATFAVVLAPAQVTKLPNISLPATEEFNLWPGTAPGEPGNIGPEHILPNRPRPFDQLADVTVPTLSVYLPPAEKRTGTAMLVIPGGGLDRLAIETEGYEIAEWLNAHGIAAFVLKYRVPTRSGGPRWKVGLQDAQRAMGLIRARAAEWMVDTDAVGAIGFSAGGEINVMMSVYHAEPRQYPRVDAADDLSSRPSFNISMYGGGFANGNAMREDIASRINKTTPPMFIAHAFDDAAMSSITLMAALKRANIPSEIHIFGAGAHGFGVRESGSPINQWRDLCLNWLAWQGFLDAPAVRSYAKSFIQARDGGAAALPRFNAAAPKGDLTQAFAAQRRIVANAIAHGDQLVGYMGAFTSLATQKSAGLKQPVHGVLLKAGRIDASPTTSVTLDAKSPILVETEIGYVIATDIGTKLRVPRQAMTTVEAMVPVIALPTDVAPLMGGKVTAADVVAANVGASKFIVGARIAPKTIENPDALAVSLQRDGKKLHGTTGADAVGGQAQNLMTLINQIIEQGHVIHQGDIIISGALGGAKPGEKGAYTADFGALGTIAFKIE